MIHYHGVPISGPKADAAKFLAGRHAFVSFAAPSQVEIVAEVCQSFALDNGAFTTWKRGEKFDTLAYADWVSKWMTHPACDFHLIPDVIDGDEDANNKLVNSWRFSGSEGAVPVYHMHEDPLRICWLASRFPRVAIGSSGVWPTPGTASWWNRMAVVMDHVCGKVRRGWAYGDGERPACKLHGLRMLSPAIFPRLPFASADSTNVARNVALDKKWDRGPYRIDCRRVRAEAIASKIESRQAAARWNGIPAGVEKSALGDLFAEAS